MCLCEEDKTMICYLAFPDSNSSCLGDTQFHFRFKQSTPPAQLSSCHSSYNKNCPVFLQIHPYYLFGFVHFRQIKDPSLPRGYFQKSVIVITRLPFLSLFTNVCSLIAPEYFANGVKSLEAASCDINRWPSPLPGEYLKLPLFGTVFQGQIPNQYSVSYLNCSTTPSCDYSTTLSSFYDFDLYSACSSIISHVHTLWELVIVAEPLVVVAPSPLSCSRLVQALVSMIVPLKYNADYRPYFTIHDSELKEFTSKSQQAPSVILGVTNPYFGKTLQHWPHVIRITDDHRPDAGSKQKLKRSSNTSLFDVKVGVYTNYKPFLVKDKSVMKKLVKGKTPSEVNSVVLKRYLLELTQSFLIPLERYMGSLMPLMKNVSPYKNAPVPLLFNQDDFLAQLETTGPRLTTTITGDWAGLYKRFFRSPNFSCWFDMRYREMTKKLKVLQLEALSHVNVSDWLKGKEEVEIVDMILKLKSKIEEIENEDLKLNEITRIHLQNKLSDVIRNLPEDLRNYVHIS